MGAVVVTRETAKLSVISLRHCSIEPLSANTRIIPLILLVFLGSLWPIFRQYNKCAFRSLPRASTAPFRRLTPTSPPISRAGASWLPQIAQRNPKPALQPALAPGATMH